MHVIYDYFIWMEASGRTVYLKSMDSGNNNAVSDSHEKTNGTSLQDVGETNVPARLLHHEKYLQWHCRCIVAKLSKAHEICLFSSVKQPTLLKTQPCRIWVYYEYHAFNTLSHVQPRTSTWRVK